MKKLQDCLYKDVCKNKCSTSCIRYIQMSRLLELSNIPKIYKKPLVIYSTDEDKKAYIRLSGIKNSIKDFVAKGKNLYICSTTCGNAKTTWAIKLMLKYFDQCWTCSYDITRGLFIHVPTLLLDLKKFDNMPEYINRIKDADLVIWDDLAVGKLTDYEHEQLLQFIDYRISTGLSNIYTGNIVDVATLINQIGARLASRVFNGSDVVTFYSNDFRAGGK